jgi:hypothetical protein
MAKATGEILRAYGFDQEEDGGALVRARRGRLMEKFVPVDGGWEFYRYEDGEWVKTKHHVDTVEEHGVRSMQANFLWPDDEVARVYGVAVKARAERAKASS